VGGGSGTKKENCLSPQKKRTIHARARVPAPTTWERFDLAKEETSREKGAKSFFKGERRSDKKKGGSIKREQRMRGRLNEKQQIKARKSCEREGGVGSLLGQDWGLRDRRKWTGGTRKAYLRKENLEGL